MTLPRAGRVRRLRSFMARAVAALSAPVLLRLSLGRWPSADERSAFCRSMRSRYVLLPPLLRALMVVPEAQLLMRHVQRLTWLYGEGGSRPDLLQERLAEAGGISDLPHCTGNIYTVWEGPPVAFLHLEKCGGMAMMQWLADLFHPQQIDPDPDRSLPPHLYYRDPAGLRRRALPYKLVWGHYGLPALERIGGDRFMFTLMREPRARVISLYHYWRSVDPALLDPASGNFTVALAHRFSLLDFLRHDEPMLRDYLDNFYVRRLTGLYATGAGTDPLAEAPDDALAAARRALARLDFVGLTERLDESAAFLASLIGAPPPAGVLRANSAAGNHAGPSGWFRGVSQTVLTAEIAAELDRLTRLDQVLYAEALARFNNGAVAENFVKEEAFS